MSWEENDEADRIASAGFTALAMPPVPFMSTILEQGSQEPKSPEGEPTVNLVPRSPPGYIPNEKPNADEPSTVRPSTPPPLKTMNDDAFIGRKYPGEVCPPSPSRLSWRKAGLTESLSSSQLIGDWSKSLSNEIDTLPRLVDRGLAFHQSSNKVQLRHNQGWNIYRLLRFNWFHVMLRWPSKYSFSFLITLWTISIIFFGWIYLWYDNLNPGSQCGLGGADGSTIDFTAAFAFSLETCTTVGKAI